MATRVLTLHCDVAIKDLLCRAIREYAYTAYPEGGSECTQVAAQIYTASLMAINVDTDAEKRYMQELADKLGLNRQVTAYLHQAVGLA